MFNTLRVLILGFMLISCNSNNDEVAELARKYVKVMNLQTLQKKNERKFQFKARAYNVLCIDEKSYSVEVPGTITITDFTDTIAATMSLDIKRFEDEWRIIGATMAYKQGNEVEKFPVSLIGSIGISEIDFILSENNSEYTSVSVKEAVDTSVIIRLPREFVCTPESNPTSQLFSDGRYTFSIYSWGHDGIEEDQLVKTVEQSYENQIKFKKTATGLYWGTGKAEDMYYYVILIPEKLYQIQVFSKYNDEKFSYYSTWLYNQISNAKDKEFYLVDYNRRSCSSN